MIPNEPADVTAAALAEYARIDDPRQRQLVLAAIRHLHAFVTETRLTEAELQQVCRVVTALGQATTPSHNEVVLAAGSTGLSALVCLLNNGERGQRETTANLMGPFWREGAPRVASGGSIVRSPTPGEPLRVTAQVRDLQGRAVTGADVDVWQASGDGFYENQDPAQAEMNLRGRFTTDGEGRIAFRTVKPIGYPIPVSGPVGALLRAAGRHNLRPAHLHFLIDAPGFKTQFAQLYLHDDPHLDSDVQFGVTHALVGRCERDAAAGEWAIDHTFVIEPGERRLPPAPITAKATAPRPALEVLASKRVD
jgi:hydroxyquinol 1,2-dioxygenase